MKIGTPLRHTFSSSALVAALVLTGCGTGADDSEAFAPEASEGKGGDLKQVATDDEAASHNEIVPFELAASTRTQTVVHLEQGWTQAERDSFYYDSTGSRWLPYSWLLALEQSASDKLFRDRANMARYGAYFGDPSPKNPNSLPIGFAKTTVAGEAWVGPNCASCHVSEITYKGKKIHIDGGAGLADQYKLVKDFSAALNATIANKDKFKRFSTKVFAPAKPSPTDQDNLRARMTEISAVLAKNSEGSGAASGPGRNDSFKFILSNTNCVVLGLPENCIGGDAKPLRFAPIWGAQLLEWDHHNSSAHNPLLRNFIAMSGYPFGSFDGTTINVNIDLSALRAVTALLNKLTEPAWPESIFGAIDVTKAARGQTVFTQRCASCHTLPPHPLTDPNVFGQQAIKSVIVPVDLSGASPASATNIGTDPGTVAYYFTEQMNPGPLAPFIDPYFVGPDGKVLASVVYQTFIGMAFQQQLMSMNLAPEQIPEFLFFRELKSAPPEQLMTIRARLPEGMYWKGNFFHNGAVKNLYEVLLPEEKRAQTFVIGDHEFDAQKLGYTNRTGQPQQFTFDTNKIGNSKRGHSGPVYGTDMSDSDRRAVLEFLKSI